MPARGRSPLERKWPARRCYPSARNWPAAVGQPRLRPGTTGCPGHWRHRPRTDAGAVNKSGGSPPDSGYRTHRRLHHRSRSTSADSQPHRRTCRATADQPNTRAACLGRPAGRSRTGLGGPGAAVTQVRLLPASAVIAPFRRRHPPATRHSPHPGPGKPPPRSLGPLRDPLRPSEVATSSPRPSHSPRGLARGACHPPRSEDSLRATPVVRAVGFPLSLYCRQTLKT